MTSDTNNIHSISNLCSLLKTKKDKRTLSLCKPYSIHLMDDAAFLNVVTMLLSQWLFTSIQHLLHHPCIIFCSPCPTPATRKWPWITCRAISSKGKRSERLLLSSEHHECDVSPILKTKCYLHDHWWMDPLTLRRTTPRAYANICTVKIFCCTVSMKEAICVIFLRRQQGNLEITGLLTCFITVFL